MSEVETKSRGRGRARPAKENNEEAKVADRGGRGGRGSYGARREQRENSQEGDEERVNRPARGGRGGGRGGGGERRERNENREDLWMYKFHHDKFRKTFDWTVEITGDMEIAAKPSPLLKEPIKEEMQNQLAEKDKEIKKLQDEKDKLIKSKQTKLNGGRVGNTNTTYREKLNGLIKEQKDFNQTKKDFLQQMHIESQAMDNIDNEMRKLQKNMHGEFSKEEDIIDALDDMKRMQSTTSISAAVEGKLVKDIAKLQKSLPFAAQYASIKPQKQIHADKKREIWSQLKDLKAEIDAKGLEIDAVKSEMDEQRVGQEELTTILDSISVKVQEKQDALNTQFEQKDQVREEYWQKMFCYREQNDEIGWINWLTEAKGNIKHEEDDRQKRLGEMNDELANIENPMKDEIDTCTYLISVCNTLKIRSGLVEDSEKVAKEMQEELAKAANKERLDKMISMNKVQAGSIKPREEEMVCIGNKGGKKNKKRKVVKQEAGNDYEEPFLLDIVTVQKFSKIRLAPPILPTDLDDKITEIEAAQVAFIANGRSGLESQREQFKSQIIVEAKLMQEEAEENRKVAQEEASTRRGGRGSRGGRGGGYGQRDAAGGRGGRGRGSRGNAGRIGGYAAKNNDDEGEDMRTHDSNAEFETKDDDVYKSAPRTAQSNHKQNQGQAKYAFNDDDFEAL